MSKFLQDRTESATDVRPGDPEQSESEAQSPAEGSGPPQGVEPIPPASFATRANILRTEGIGKNKLFLLGGGLAVAVLFFIFTAVVGKSSKKHATTAPQAQQLKVEARPAKGSVTPLMETVRPQAPDNGGGQLGPADIRRTRATDGAAPIAPGVINTKATQPNKPSVGQPLASVPTFADTQQRWEEPKPYAEQNPLPIPSVGSAIQNQQQGNALKEASLVFVRNQTQTLASGVRQLETQAADPPFLDVKPGTRVQAKLETQISSAVQAPVVAIVEYTYAIGDKIVLPAGARVYGQLQQADRSGLVSIKFEEVELLDGAREKIEAIGTGLDLGPLHGTVSGTNAGRNFMVRAASGVGSLLAQVAGTNTSAAFSEQDILRQRVAENIGTAGDTEVMNLNSNSRIVVSVPADTKLYIVFTKHDENTSSDRTGTAPHS